MAAYGPAIKLCGYLIMSNWSLFLNRAKTPLTELQKLKLHKARTESSIAGLEKNIKEFQRWSEENRKRAREDREYGTCSEDFDQLVRLRYALERINEKIACLETENSV